MTDDLYIDSRGAEMPAMSWSEALEIGHSLANGNQIDANDIAFGDDGLAGMREWQQTAIDTVGDFITNHAESLDELAPSEQAKEWPLEILHADRSVDPNALPDAIRIVLACAEQGALDPKDADGIELADEIDRQQQALDMIRDLLGMHGAELDKVVSIDITPIV